jgi:hypothetical protein
MSDENLVRIRNREIADAMRSLLYFALIAIATVVIIASVVLVL